MQSHNEAVAVYLVGEGRQRKRASKTSTSRKRTSAKSKPRRARSRSPARKSKSPARRGKSHSRRGRSNASPRRVREDVTFDDVVGQNGFVCGYEYQNVPLPAETKLSKKIQATNITFKVPYTPIYQLMPLRVTKDWDCSDGTVLHLTRYFLFVPPLQEGQTFDHIQNSNVRAEITTDSGRIYEIALDEFQQAIATRVKVALDRFNRLVSPDRSRLGKSLEDVQMQDQREARARSPQLSRTSSAPQLIRTPITAPTFIPAAMQAPVATPTAPHIQPGLDSEGSKDGEVISNSLSSVPTKSKSGSGSDSLDG